MFQFGDTLHTGCGQQAMDIVRNLVVIIYPGDIRIARQIDALITNGWYVQCFGNPDNRQVEL